MLTSVRGLVAASLVIGCGLAATPAFAGETDAPAAITVTGSASLVSQYRFRGLAQSDNKPVVQAAMTATHSSGFYVGTWASSASAGDGPINIGGTEIDVFGGYTHALGGSGVTLDAGVYGYLYPGATAGNYYEVYGSLAKSVGPVTAKVGANFAPAQKVFNYNWTSPSRSNTYVFGELSSGIVGTPLTVHSHLGHSGGGFNWAKAYLDYSVGVAYKWHALTLDASLVGTNVGKSDISSAFACAGGAACINSYNRMSKATGVVTLSASF